MSHYKFIKVNTRKNHTCLSCKRPIKKGDSLYTSACYKYKFCQDCFYGNDE